MIIYFQRHRRNNSSAPQRIYDVSIRSGAQTHDMPQLKCTFFLTHSAWCMRALQLTHWASDGSKSISSRMSVISARTERAINCVCVYKQGILSFPLLHRESEWINSKLLIKRAAAEASGAVEWIFFVYTPSIYKYLYYFIEFTCTAALNKYNLRPMPCQ